MAKTSARLGGNPKSEEGNPEQSRFEGSIGADDLLRLRRLSYVASLMDMAVGIPLTRLRIGAVAVRGLVAFVGDAAGTLVKLYLVNEARRPIVHSSNVLYRAVIHQDARPGNAFVNPSQDEVSPPREFVLTST